MRSLEQAREAWQELQQYESLSKLKAAVRLESGSSVATNGLRSACWKAFLLFDTLDLAEWQHTLSASRSAYNSLRSHFFKYIENPEDAGMGFDPLSQDNESSPWSQMHKDEVLRAEILQDVERCMPETPFFRQKQTQRILLDILFIFCRLNPDVGYRQGMHEIAATVLWVTWDDAIDFGHGSKALGEDGIIKTLFDAEHIEHDTFALFGQVMQNAKAFYLSDGPASIASRSHHIFNELLPLVDRELMKHLESLEIVPQVFCIRWVRLLFGREFDFDSVLALWDVIFAENSSLEIVEHICLAMLLRIRWHLLDADYNGALGLLLKYPEQDRDFPPQTFALDALYLKTHTTTQGGSYLVLKYTGRPLVTGRPATPPALQRNITTNAVRTAERRNKLSPPRASRQARNIEALLQSTAKNIYARGEKLGIGKVVRSAVDEVHKKAQEIREAQTPSPRKAGSGLLMNHIQELESRNKKLAELLSGAVNELWEYQKLITQEENDPGHRKDDEAVQKLSTAIAQVQFVQVYLNEPSLSLPQDDRRPEKYDEDALHSSQIIPPRLDPALQGEGSLMDDEAESEVFKSTMFEYDQLADPSTFDNFDEASPANQEDSHPSVNAGLRNAEPFIAAPTEAATAQNTLTAEGTDVKTARPTLEQSPFSFMLGQESEASSTGNAGTPSRARARAGGSLFGGGVRDRSTSRQPLKTEAEDPLKAQEDDFDIGSLRRAKGAKK